ncbi:MAG: hypothetical protein ACYC3H_07885 [Bellilinea sp.]
MKRCPILLLLFVFLISGCKGTETDPLISTPKANSTLSSNFYDPGYPVTTAPQPTAIEVTRDASMGIVSGTILLNDKPVNNLRLFLADILQSGDGVEVATSLDRSVAPTSLSNNEGKFNFLNVPPGRYGLMLYEGVNSYLLLDPSNGEAILISVDADEEIDLGIYRYTDLPIN